MNFDYQSAFMAAFSTISFGGVVTAIISYGETREFKRNVTEKIDTNKKDITDRVSVNFSLLKDEIVAHEQRDDTRHKEIMERISGAEQNIIEGLRNK